MRRLQIYIDEDMDELLAAVARREGRSKAALIREAVEERHGRQRVNDPLDDWVGSIDAKPGDIDALVYGG